MSKTTDNPTTELRWVQRNVIGPFHSSPGEKTLQQRWMITHFTDSEVRIIEGVTEEWRDVPTVVE